MRARARCTFSKEALALHVESDLPDAAARTTARHLEACEECRTFFEQLRAAQSALKSLRREVVSPSECTEVRRAVMSIIDARLDRPGWILRVERALVLGFRERAYAVAAVAGIAIVSVSALAQMRPAPPAAGSFAAQTPSAVQTPQAAQTPAAAQTPPASRRPGDGEPSRVRKAHEIWFMDFSGLESTLKAKLQALPDSSGCRMCHPHT
jgi:anti-sigma factor RsiW